MNAQPKPDPAPTKSREQIVAERLAWWNEWMAIQARYLKDGDPVPTREEILAEIEEADDDSYPETAGC